MTLDQLRYFLEASKFEHVGKAAKSLAISPSAISAAIAALEGELGTPLFDRPGKAIAINPQGRKLQAHAESLLSHLDSIRGEFTDGNAATLEGTYRLGGSHFLATQLLAPAWFKLQDEHPGLIGELHSMNTAEVLRGVLDGSLDLGLCFSPQRQPGLTQTDLHTGRLVIAVRKHHPLLAKSAAQSLKSLSQYPAALHKGSSGVDLCETHPIFERYGIKPCPALLFGNDLFALEKIRTTDAWALLPERVVRAASPKLAELPLPRDWDASYTIACVTREHRESNPALTLLRRQIATLLKS